MNLSLIAIVLVGLVAALCGLVVANLKAQQRDVQAAWNRLDGLRRRGMEAVPAFVAAVSQDEAAAQRVASSPSVVHRALDDVAAASRASASAEDPHAAAAADDRLVQAIERVYAATEVEPDFVASPASRKASAQLDAAMEALAHEQQIYNNVATIATNAQRSFPALLFAKRLGLSEPQRLRVGSGRPARRARLDAREPPLARRRLSACHEPPDALGLRHGRRRHRRSHRRAAPLRSQPHLPPSPARPSRMTAVQLAGNSGYTSPFSPLRSHRAALPLATSPSRKPSLVSG